MEIGAQFACAISAFTDEICTPTIEKWQNVFQFLKTFKQNSENDGKARRNQLVETDSPALSLRTVELLMFPLTCKVYVVAPRFSIVFHSGA